MRQIHPDLLVDMQQSSTTLTELLLIGPLPDLSYRPLAMLDQDVVYNSGGGSRTYKARTGFQMSALVATNDMGVDNAEAEILSPVATFEIEGFTQEQIDSGALDAVPFVVYIVNYRNLATGRHAIKGGGTIGELRSRHGQVTVAELRSLSQQLKQSIVELDSLTCRVKRFGSQVGEERFPCLATRDWIAGEVTSVSGADPYLEFTDTALLQADNYFAPGLLRWTSGANEGQEQEVDAFADSIILLKFSTTSPIEDGDEFEISRDCSRVYTGHNSCETHHGSDKNLHFRGEPHIPVADAAALNTPGVAITEGGETGGGGK